jgi:DsbC/DsbD-like thiol-disulfide interchange protein
LKLNVSAICALLLALALLPCSASAQIPDWLRDPRADQVGEGSSGPASAKPGHVEVALVSESAALRPGQVNWVGLRMKHDPQWHTYWKNPGDAGLPTTVSWKLPAGYKAGEFEWPHPQRIQVGSLASYGYEGDVMLPVQLFTAREARAGDTVRVQADVRWLACKDVCVPEQAHLELLLPVAERASTSPSAALFAQTRLKWPAVLAGSSAAARALPAQSIAGAESVAVEVGIEFPDHRVGKGQLYFEHPDFVEPGIVPQVEVRHGKVVWKSQLTRNGRKLAATRLPAVWVPDAAEDAASSATAVRLTVQWSGCTC